MLNKDWNKILNNLNSFHDRIKNIEKKSVKAEYIKGVKK